MEFGHDAMSKPVSEAARAELRPDYPLSCLYRPVQYCTVQYIQDPTVQSSPPAQAPPSRPYRREQVMDSSCSSGGSFQSKRVSSSQYGTFVGCSHMVPRAFACSHHERMATVFACPVRYGHGVSAVLVPDGGVGTS